MSITEGNPELIGYNVQNHQHVPFEFTENKLHAIRVVF